MSKQGKIIKMLEDFNFCFVETHGEDGCIQRTEEYLTFQKIINAVKEAGEAE